MIPPTPTPILVDAREAARLLAVSDRTLYSLTSPRGPIPTIRLGDGPRSQRRYRVADLSAWAAAAAAKK